MVVPTTGRASIRELQTAVWGQTRRPDKVALLRGRDVPTGLADLSAALDSYELLAVADDDAVPPADWLERAEAYFEDPGVGYVCGALAPGEGDALTGTQRIVQAVQSSRFGSFTMAERYRPEEGGAREVDEQGIHGMGVWRASAYRQALLALGNLPHAGWEDNVATWMRGAGLRVVRDSALSSRHPPRATVGAFARQMWKCGSGRAVYFKVWPRELARKPWHLAPTASVVGLLVLPLVSPTALALLALAYASVAAASGGLRSVPYYAVCHLSYGLGFVAGLGGRVVRPAQAVI